MQANWSLIINILLLMAVLFSIVRLVRKRQNSLDNRQAAVDMPEVPALNLDSDDIIAVRKVNAEETAEAMPVVNAFAEAKPAKSARKKPLPRYKEPVVEAKPATLMMLLKARENRQFAGYELLQTLLAAGLRFGEGQLFHRHQFANGQGPILCSLAAATESGIFDLQNIGAFSVKGLCLFMETSGNAKIDEERFTIMLDTARQLAEGLDALLLDDLRRPLTDPRIARYYELLNLHALI